MSVLYLVVEKICGLHKDLWAHECVVSSGGGNGWGYIGTFKPMIMLYPMVGKLTGLYRDLWAYGCIVISGREINKVTYGLVSLQVHYNQ
jgi:hypothetical protein